MVATGAVDGGGAATAGPVVGTDGAGALRMAPVPVSGGKGAGCLGTAA